MTPTNLDVKALTKLGRLSIPQIRKYLDSDNYKLRNAELSILRNDLSSSGYLTSTPLSPIRLIGVNEDDELLISIDGKNQPFDIGKDFVVIIFVDGEPKHVVFNNND